VTLAHAVCYSMLQCVAVYCSVLQYLAVCCSMLQCVAVSCSVLQYVAVGCSMMQWVAVSVLYYVAECCRVGWRGRATLAHAVLQRVEVCCSQCVAPCCSQCVAVPCSVLQLQIGEVERH